MSARAYPFLTERKLSTHKPLLMQCCYWRRMERREKKTGWKPNQLTARQSIISMCNNLVENKIVRSSEFQGERILDVATKMCSFGNRLK